jgi:hypothetical protein
MKKMGRTAVACLALLVSSGTIISGHHSQALFDLDNQITLEGKIVEAVWGNPHSLFFVEGKKVGEPDSQIKKWAMEGPSPTSLTRAGWTQDVLKVGDQITAKGNGSRTGRAMMLLKEVTTSDGKVWQTGPQQGNFNRRLADEAPEKY